MAKSLVGKANGSNRQLVRVIKQIENEKHLYYGVTHYKDHDDGASYERTTLKYYLDKKHRHYVGHSSVIESRIF